MLLPCVSASACVCVWCVYLMHVLMTVAHTYYVYCTVRFIAANNGRCIDNGPHINYQTTTMIINCTRALSENRLLIGALSFWRHRTYRVHILIYDYIYMLRKSSAINNPRTFLLRLIGEKPKFTENSEHYTIEYRQHHFIIFIRCKISLITAISNTLI